MKKNPFNKFVGEAKKLKKGEKFSFYIGYAEFFSVDTDEYPLDKIWYLENETELLQYILHEAEKNEEDYLEYLHDSLVCSFLEEGFDVDFIPNVVQWFRKENMHGAYIIKKVI